MCGKTASRCESCPDRQLALHLVLRLARRDAQLGLAEEAPARRQHDGGVDLLVDGPLGEIQADRGRIGLGLAALVVMDLEEDVGAGRQCAGGALGRQVGPAPGAQPQSWPDGMKGIPPGSRP